MTQDSLDGISQISDDVYENQNLREDQALGKSVSVYF